jgi:Tfp pilus assembly protein PilE
MFVKNSGKNKSRGIGLLELMLSIAIIAILLVMATRYYMSARQSQQIGDAVSMVSGIMSGAAHFSNAHGHTYTGITLQSLVGAGNVPASFCGTGTAATCGNNANPWKGNLSVAETAAAGGYVITMADLPTNDVCNGVAGMVNTSINNSRTSTNQSVAACATTTLTVTVY